MNEPTVQEIEKLLAGDGDTLSEQQIAAIVASATIVLAQSDTVDSLLSGVNGPTELALSGIFMGALELAARWGWLDDDIDEIRAVTRARLKKGHSVG